MDPNFTVEQEEKNKFPLSKGALYALGIVFVLFVISILSIYVYYPIEKTKDDQISSVELDEVQQIPRSLTIYKSFPNFFGVPKSIFSDPKDSNLIWLRGDGGVLEYNLEEEKINKTIAGSDSIDTVPMSIAIIGNNLFISFKGGFKKINLTTKESRTYREEDGLVSGSGVNLFPDPYDKKIIWIGTFKGLSKFNIEDETFINFQEEAGIVGTQLVINSKVRVGKNFVWLIGNAHANSKGGVARYDKINNTWKSWGPESFGKMSRVDFSEFDINENRAFIIDPSSNDIFAYKPSTDSWEVIAKGEDTARRHLAYSGDRVYFVERTNEGVIKYINLSDYSLHSLKISGFMNIYNDISHERLILFSSREANNKIVILDPKTNEQKIILLNINKEYTLTGIIDLYQDFIFFKSSKDFYIYDRSNRNWVRIENVTLSGSAQDKQTIEVIGKKLILVDMPISEIGSPNKSIFLISLENFKLETKAEIEGFFDKVIFGNSLSEIYFVKQLQDNTTVYRFSTDAIENSKLILEDLETVDSSILGQTKEENYKIISTTNNDNSLTVESKKRVNGNTISVKFVYKDRPIQHITKTFSLGARYHNPFDWPPVAAVTNIKFSKTNPKVLWIGTNRGLIWYDTETDNSKLFVLENGLASNSIEELFIDNQIIVEHPIGVYIYSIDF